MAIRYAWRGIHPSSGGGAVRGRNPKESEIQQMSRIGSGLALGVKRVILLNDVYTNFGIVDLLPPCLHSGMIHST